MDGLDFLNIDTIFDHITSSIYKQGKGVFNQEAFSGVLWELIGHN